MAKRSDYQNFALNFEGMPAAAALEPITHLYTNWLHCVAKMNGEAVQFVSKRLKEDFAMPSRLADCHSPAEVYETQLAFAQKMATDYAQEAQRMMGMVAQVTDELHAPRSRKAS